MPEVPEKFEGWCVVEIMGHQTFAGYVSEQVIGGQSFVRVDVPECDTEPAFSKCFGGAAIYCITPVSEEVARAAAKRTHSQPISVWLPELHPQPDQKQIAAANFDPPDDIDPYIARDEAIDWNEE